MGIRERLKDNRILRSVSRIIELGRAHIVLASVLIIVFLVVGSFAGYKTTKYMESPEFCAISICHKSMAPYGEAWKKSSHAQQNLGYKCMECHAETRIGPIQTKYFGTLMSHALDGPPLFLAVIEGKVPHTEFDPFIPTIQSERCLRCHAPDADNDDAYPVSAEDHSSPIDVSEMFEWTLENPRGNKYVCKNCHSFIAHPTDTEILPSERGEKYESTHPGFPKIDLGAWQQTHFHLLRDGGKDGKEFVYSGEDHENDFKITASDIEINRVARSLDKDMCLICHKIERLRPENMDGKCQGCHNHGEITLYHHEPILHLPNPNDKFGTIGVVGGPLAGGEAGGH
jgi:nitrate reductase cytochrome c-type subunit